MTREEFSALCEGYGAYKSFIVAVEDIPTDEKLREYCEMNYCGCYNKNYACPPQIGTPTNVVAKLRRYKSAFVFQTVTALEDSYDIEGMTAAAQRHSDIADKLEADIKAQYPRFLKLTAGGCTICKVCAKATNEPCRFPDRAVSSLEAYCMDVSTLAKICEMNYINGKDTVTYFGVFLV